MEVEGVEDSADANALDFLLEKESPAKKTNMNNNLEVNSKLLFDCNYFIALQ